MDVIKIENLNLNFGSKVIYNNLNLEIKEKTWNSLLGSNGSGKTTLLKVILGLIKSDSVYIDGVKLDDNSKYEIRKKMGCVFENPNYNLMCETVEEELANPLENLNVEEKEINIRIDNIIRLFKFSKEKKTSIKDLTIDEKQILSIMVSLITSPKILILDEAFTFMNKSEKKRILKILKKLDITIISVTHDVEELLFSDNLIILEEGKIKTNDKKENIFEKEILDDFPFIVELSKKLQYYDLVNDISYSYKELVDKIWE